MILKPAQAKAVYDAMCALNNVTAATGIRISFIGNLQGEPHRIHIEETEGNRVRVSCLNHDVEAEQYDGQHLFASAYGLLKGDLMPPPPRPPQGVIPVRMVWRSVRHPSSVGYAVRQKDKAGEWSYRMTTDDAPTIQRFDTRDAAVQEARRLNDGKA